MTKEPNKQITNSYVTVPKNFYDMTFEEQREFLGSVLRGISPNPAVRATAGKKFRKKPKK